VVADLGALLSLALVSQPAVDLVAVHGLGREGSPRDIVSTDRGRTFRAHS
jgi:hypothetical protein